jgi:hypothetical protein
LTVGKLCVILITIKQLKDIQMFPSRKTNSEPTALAAIKDWRDAGHEIEALGTRLDQARTAAIAAKGSWAKNYWATTVERLFTRWQLMVQLKDTGLRQKGPESFYANIDYNWWERSEEIRMASVPFLDNMFDNAGLDRRLDESWARAREEKVQKARQGLA